MMSLDRGGQCQGVVFSLAADNLEGQLGKLVRREMTVKPPNNLPQWITVKTDQEPLRATVLHGWVGERTFPTPCFGLGNADGLRASKLKHAVQGMNGDGDLRPAPLVRP
jgi:cation transport regulator ChaC